MDSMNGIETLNPRTLTVESIRPRGGTKETVNRCLIYLHVISLVALPQLETTCRMCTAIQVRSGHHAWI